MRRAGAFYTKDMIPTLWGAAADDLREPEWAYVSRVNSPEDKRPLTVYELLDYLLSLPDIFSDAVFVSFSLGYDVTQILKSFPFKKVWEICKREKYAPKKEDRRPIGKGPVYWGEYTFEYLKGKWFKNLPHSRSAKRTSAQSMKMEKLYPNTIRQSRFTTRSVFFNRVFQQWSMVWLKPGGRSRPRPSISIR